jgi:hypothetical protein
MNLFSDRNESFLDNHRIKHASDRMNRIKYNNLNRKQSTKGIESLKTPRILN